MHIKNQEMKNKKTQEITKSINQTTKQLINEYELKASERERLRSMLTSRWKHH